MEEKKKSLFANISGLAKSAVDGVASGASSATNAVASTANAAANAVVSEAKSLIPEKKPETQLLFFRDDFLIFEDRFEKSGRKFYFEKLVNLKIERRVEKTKKSVGATFSRAALGALNGAANAPSPED